AVDYCGFRRVCLTPAHVRAIVLAYRVRLKWIESGAARAKSSHLILVFYAFAREVGPLKRRLQNRAPLADNGLRGFRAQAGRHDAVFIATGMGPARARDVARRALSTFDDIEMLVVTGVAGALSSGLRAGDIVVADRVLRAGEDHWRPEHILEVAEDHIHTTTHALREAGLDTSTGAILTVPRVLSTSEEKRRAQEESGAIAV